MFIVGCINMKRIKYAVFSIFLTLSFCLITTSAASASDSNFMNEKSNLGYLVSVNKVEFDDGSYLIEKNLC